MNFEYVIEIANNICSNSVIHQVSLLKLLDLHCIKCLLVLGAVLLKIKAKVQIFLGKLLILAQHNI